MAKTRQERGNYARTPEQNEKMVASMQKARDEGRLAISEEARLRLSQQMKAAWESGKLSAENAGQHMKTPEHRERNSRVHKGKVVSIETRKKLSEHSRHQTHRFSRCRGGHRVDLNMYFRSSWEANYARYLTHVGMQWAYEQKTFDLGDGLTYTPDFELADGTLIEIKGWLTEEGATKLARFRTLFPEVKLAVVNRTDYRALYQQFSEIIPHWEKVNT